MSESTTEHKIRDENLPPPPSRKGIKCSSSTESEERPKKRKRKAKSSSLRTSEAASKSQGSKYRGVCRNRRKWQAVIWVQGKRKYLGTFKDEELAAKAYDAAAIEYRGARASLNFPTPESKHSGAVRNKTGERKTRKAKRKRKLSEEGNRIKHSNTTPTYASPRSGLSDYDLSHAFFSAFDASKKLLPFQTEQDLIQVYNAALALSAFNNNSSRTGNVSLYSPVKSIGTVNGDVSVVESKGGGAGSSGYSSPIRAK